MWLLRRPQSFDEVSSIVSIHEVDEEMPASSSSEYLHSDLFSESSSTADLLHIGPKAQYTFIFGAYSKGDIRGIKNRWSLL